ncbi:MAG: PilZ domain-containing protein [Candidatus Omnitrophica bacterium]|nr:PilZ domain-containing protein [Candidatus Omnitrophota bacterium]
MSPQRILKTKIGEMLIERGLISKEQLSTALAQQREKGGYLSQHLIALGFVSEVHIAECLASQYGFAYLPLDRYQISPQTLKIIPFKLINIYSLLPIEKAGNSLDVVMADPLNEGVIDMLKHISGCDIEVFISTYSQIRQAIDTYFHAEMQDTSLGRLDAVELIKEDMLESFIQVKDYGSGREKRRYKRKDVDLDMVYFLQNKSYKAKIKNISYGGLLFTCELFIPIEKNIYTNIVCRILTQNVDISAVVQVIRVEKTGETQYSIAGFFNFITDDDRMKLTLLLQQ